MQSNLVHEEGGSLAQLCTAYEGRDGAGGVQTRGLLDALARNENGDHRQALDNDQNEQVRPGYCQFWNHQIFCFAWIVKPTRWLIVMRLSAQIYFILSPVMSDHTLLIHMLLGRSLLKTWGLINYSVAVQSARLRSDISPTNWVFVQDFTGIICCFIIKTSDPSLAPLDNHTTDAPFKFEYCLFFIGSSPVLYWTSTLPIRSYLGGSVNEGNVLSNYFFIYWMVRLLVGLYSLYQRPYKFEIF